MRRARTLAAVVLGLAGALLGAAAPASALVTGVGDQFRWFLDDPQFQALGVDYVRVIVPWNAALTGDQRVEEWLQRAEDLGKVPLVAFEHEPGTQCPSAPCVPPTVAAYEQAVAAFLARWPQVHEVVPWNEPNHRAQPTAGRPALAADFYDAARRVCPSCTLVAADVLDDPDTVGRWLAAYRAALDTQPTVWGLHNYYDATYGTSSGVDRFLATVPGEVWLTETGGIVRFRSASGGGLPEDEDRAAQGIRWLYVMLPARPRVTRMYLYQWQSTPFSDFDAGLVRPDGTARPSLAEVRAALGVKDPPPATRPRDGVPEAPAEVQAGGGGTPAERREAAATAAALEAVQAARVTTRAGATVGLAGKGLLLRGTLLSATLNCISDDGDRCTGGLRFVLPGGTRPRLAFRIAGGSTARLRVRLFRTARRAVITRRRVRVRLCADDAGRATCAASTVRVSVLR